MFLPTKRPAEEQLSQDDSEEEGPALGGWAEDRRRQQLLKKHRVRQTQAKLGQRSGVQSASGRAAIVNNQFLEDHHAAWQEQEHQQQHGQPGDPSALPELDQLLGEIAKTGSHLQPTGCSKQATAALDDCGGELQQLEGGGGDGNGHAALPHCGGVQALEGGGASTPPPPHLRAAHDSAQQQEQQQQHGQETSRPVQSLLRSLLQPSSTPHRGVGAPPPVQPGALQASQQQARAQAAWPGPTPPPKARGGGGIASILYQTPQPPSSARGGGGGGGSSTAKRPTKKPKFSVKEAPATTPTTGPAALGQLLLGGSQAARPGAAAAAPARHMLEHAPAANTPAMTPARMLQRLGLARGAGAVGGGGVFDLQVEGSPGAGSTQAPAECSPAGGGDGGPSHTAAGFTTPAPAQQRPHAHQQQQQQQQPSSAHELLSHQRSLQRAFLAALPPSAPATTPQRGGRGAAASGSLNGRMQAVLQRQKAQQDRLAGLGSSTPAAAPAEDALPLTVLERSWEAQLTKCLCSCPSRPAGAQHVQLFVQSKACPVVDFSPGCRLLVYAPWCEVQLPGQQAPVVLAHLVVQAM